MNILLPPPRKDGTMSLEAALNCRHSVRKFKPDALSNEEVSQLLWAGNGISDYGRTVPSAGALYPLKIIVAMKTGIYSYDSTLHNLSQYSDKDVRLQLAADSGGQTWMKDAYMILIIMIDRNKTANKYGERADRYVCMEVGNASQNVSLQAAALGLGTVIVGAFNDTQVLTTLNLAAYIHPICIMPIGKI